MTSKLLLDAAVVATSNISKEMSNNFVQKIKKHFKDENIKYDIDSGDIFEKYIINAKGKYEKVKTIINSNPKSLYDLYETVEIQCGKRVIDTLNVNDILKIGNKMILIGTGGIGKTMTMKHLFLKTIEIGDYTPVFIELRSINEFDIDSFDLGAYINDTLNNMGLHLEYEHFEYSMKSGCYTIFLDGFDELNEACVRKVEKEIIRLSDKYSTNKYLISSRPMNQFTGWNDFMELESLPLSKGKALSLVSKLPYDDSAKNKFYNALKEEYYERYKSFASNPLLLTIMLITFNTNAKIPNNLNEFYEQAFYALFYRHDASKKTFVREKRCKLECEDFKRIFSYFCFKTFFDTRFEFDDNLLYRYLQRAKEKLQLEFNEEDYIYDLEHSVCLLVRDGLSYKFAHRSFQEYFAALYTIQLNDDNQKKLLKMWSQQNFHFQMLTTHYLDMLNDLEEERFFNNFLISGLEKLNKKYEKLNYSVYDLVKEIVYGVRIVPIKNQRFYISVEDEYLYNIIYLTSRNKKMVHYKKTIPKELLDKVLKLSDKLSDNRKANRLYSFELLEQNGLDKEVIDVISIKYFVEFALNVYDEYINEKKERIQKFETFLDKL